MTLKLRRPYATPVGQFDEVVLDEERSLRLVLTGNCNLACEFCAYKVKDFYSPEVHSERFVEMEPRYELRKLLKEMRRNLNYDIAHLTGGEPGIAKHLSEIGELCQDESYSINMCSNLVYTKPIVRLIDRGLISELTFSYVPLDSGEQRSQLLVYQRPDEARIGNTLENISHLRSRYHELVIKTNIIMSPFSDIENTAGFIDWCWNNEVKPRVQRDRSSLRISESTDNTKKLLDALKMEPKKVIIKVPGATESCEFEDPNGREMHVKVFNKNYRPQEVCKLCDESNCVKSLSSIRVYDTTNEPVLCLCTLRDDNFSNVTVDQFLKSSVFNEIKGYKTDPISYFDKFCAHPNFQ
ncbi:radical SAM protein [archaeon]|nr:MAG: radical SAM protein [archaeon]